MPAPAQIPEPGDEQLMQLVCKGDRNAFELLYERYFHKLTWFARSFVNSEEKAEDAVQEVFIKIIEKPELFDENRKFSTWVYTVTANTCKKILRNEQNRSRLLQENVIPQHTQSNMHHQADYRLLREQIQATYRALNEKEKNIFVLRFEHELSIKEIAAIAGIPEGSVKSGIYYMLKKFAKNLKDFTHGK